MLRYIAFVYVVLKCALSSAQGYGYSSPYPYPPQDPYAQQQYRYAQQDPYASRAQYQPRGNNQYVSEDQKVLLKEFYQELIKKVADIKKKDLQKVPDALNKFTRKFSEDRKLDPVLYNFLMSVTERMIENIQAKKINLGWVLYKSLTPSSKARARFEQGVRIDLNALNIYQNMKKNPLDRLVVNFDDIIILLIQTGDNLFKKATCRGYEECSAAHSAEILGALQNAGLNVEFKQKTGIDLNALFSNISLDIVGPITKTFAEYLGASYVTQVGGASVQNLRQEHDAKNAFKQKMTIKAAPVLPWTVEANTDFNASTLNDTALGVNADIVKGVTKQLAFAMAEAREKGETYDEKAKSMILALDNIKVSLERSGLQDDRSSQQLQFIQNVRTKIWNAMQTSFFPTEIFVFRAMNEQYQELFKNGQRVNTDTKNQYISLVQSGKKPKIESGLVIMLAIQSMDAIKDRCNSRDNCAKQNFDILDDLQATFSDDKNVTNQLQSIHQRLEDEMKKHGPYPVAFKALTEGLAPDDVKTLQTTLAQKYNIDFVVYDSIKPSNDEWAKLRKIPMKKQVYPWNRVEDDSDNDNEDSKESEKVTNQTVGIVSGFLGKLFG